MSALVTLRQQVIEWHNIDTFGVVVASMLTPVVLAALAFAMFAIVRMLL